MGLLDRIFGSKEKDGEGGPASAQFHETESTQQDDSEGQGSRNAPRRELVQVILRDTMRKHGIPSDWIECRVLSTISRSGRPGLHVNFVVRQAHDQLLTYVFAFQDSFEREFARFEPRYRDWLMSLGWEFQDVKMETLPHPKAWAPSQPAPLAAQQPEDNSFAFAPTADPAEDEAPKTEEDVQRDLQALFAIRDAAMADTQRKSRPRPADQPDFQPTQPFKDPGESRS
jgi:hypothetical protein